MKNEEQELQIAAAEMMFTAFGATTDHRVFIALREALRVGVAIGEGRAAEVLPPALLERARTTKEHEANQRLQGPLNEMMPAFGIGGRSIF
jgi:hypothetical protein